MAALRLIFLGPPGSGKGTQARRLAARCKLVPLSSGDVLRREIEAGSETGEQAAEFVRSGGLVPDEVVTAVMLTGIDKLPRGTGFILDGFPRTVPQADALNEGLSANGDRIHGAIDFRLSDDEIVARITTRRICTKCGRTYNIDHFPPKVAGVCDDCGGALVQREDDNEAVIKKRLETYRQQTAPLVAYYQNRGLLCSIDASQPADTVETNVAQVAESLLK